MQFIDYYLSPLGKILLAADEQKLIGLWFEGQKYFADTLTADYTIQETPVLSQTKQWLDIYFSGKEPPFRPPFYLQGTPFQKDVWQILCKIPYGKTITYGEIARQLASQRGIKRLSAQAVGHAVGKNSISIIVPCHRVIGATGHLIGYAGGLSCKKALLQLENALDSQHVKTAPRFD